MAITLPKLEMPSWLRLPRRAPSAPARTGMAALLDPKLPEVAFDVDQRSVAMVRLGKRKKERFIASYEVVELPPDLFDIDFYSVHLKSPERFRELVGGIVRKEDLKLERVSLLLPDNYARVAILSLASLPRKRSDAIEMLRWKTKKAVPFKVDDAAIDFMTLPGDGTGVDVLAVLTPRAIVEGFESAFTSLGIHAGLVDLSTLSLLNLYRPVIDADIRNGAECMAANVSGGFVTFVIFRAGRMVFFRSKPFPLGVIEGGEAASLRMVRRELQTSLLYYREKLDGRELARTYLRVVEHSPEAVAAIFNEQPEIAEVDWIDPRRVIDVNGRMSGEQGEKLLQRLAPALGATIGRESR
ncbi:MAG TPA: pilus assembly protein PilM [Candidatus Saccharimonadales bacterium]|nr:pilus assembly protein PilM [Candidatus Saccharimonadales bacterium]